MTVVIVQCRLSSTRLPNKAMMDLGGRPVVSWTLRAMKTAFGNKVRYVLATDSESIETLRPIALECDYEIMAGPLEDVLERFCMVVRETNADTVVRATADNPYLFYEAAEALLQEYDRRNDVDYITYTGLPHGSGVEIIKGQSLLKAAENTDDPYDREHVGPALYNHKDKFHCVMLPCPARFNKSDAVTTIDTASHLRRARMIERVVMRSRAAHSTASKEHIASFTTEEILASLSNQCVSHPVLFVPQILRGHGTGHLRRCIETAIGVDGFVYISEEEDALDDKMVQDILSSYEERALASWQVVREEPQPGEYALIVADRFVMTKEDALSFSSCAPLIALDEGTQFTDMCDGLIDIIPSALKRQANITDPSLIQQPSRVVTHGKAQKASDLRNILVCFGGEDPARLTYTAVETLAGQERKITVITYEPMPAGLNEVTVIPYAANLRDMLANYDLVVTHYGLTAYEAAAAGCAVLLCATTKLHGELAAKYGFVCLERKELTRESVTALLEHPASLYPAVQSTHSAKHTLCDIVRQAAMGARLSCPVCGSNAGQVVARTASHTYRRCRECGMIYMAWTISGDIDYGADYFGVQYKAQYGKTYLEDFDAIKTQGTRRIGIIDKIAGEHKGAVLLDVGCAYGPFLDAASEDGWRVFGTDISEDAVRYVQSTLMYPAICAHFPHFNAGESFGMPQFDAVTMWYVIEHFHDLDKVLLTVASLVKTGGVFAFSTPSGEGVSAKLRSDDFFAASPADHYTIWEPTKASGILHRYGFNVVRTVSTGHHAQRFPIVAKHGWKEDSPLFKATEQLSRLLHMGDTCEIYCKKVQR